MASAARVASFTATVRSHGSFGGASVGGASVARAVDCSRWSRNRFNPWDSGKWPSSGRLVPRSCGGAVRCISVSIGAIGRSNCPARGPNACVMMSSRCARMRRSSRVSFCSSSRSSSHRASFRWSSCSSSQWASRKAGEADDGCDDPLTWHGGSPPVEASAGSASAEGAALIEALIITR